ALALPGTESASTTETRKHERRRGFPAELGLALFVAVFFGALHLITGRFLAADSIAGLLAEGSLLFVCAAGAMLVLVAGGLDISLGAIVALSAGVAGQLWEQGHPLSLVLPVAVLVGAAAGFLNAALAILGQVHPIVVTLGTMSIYRGWTLYWLGQDVQIASQQRGWALANWLGVPVLAWCGLALAVGLALWLRRTVTGRQLFALGSNPRAARRVGISAGRVWLCAFTLQGALAGLAGILFLARSGSLQPTSHEDVTLQAIAAAVVGGVAITGGRGSILGVVVGCLLLVSLEPACIYLRLSPHWRLSLVGAVLLAAVVFDTLLRRRAVA
ncbi:MAG: ABC transporter permease, partial [Gemmataceae bacterium]